MLSTRHEQDLNSHIEGQQKMLLTTKWNLYVIHECFVRFIDAYRHFQQLFNYFSAKIVTFSKLFSYFKKGLHLQ